MNSVKSSTRYLTLLSHLLFANGESGNCESGSLLNRGSNQATSAASQNDSNRIESLTEVLTTFGSRTDYSELWALATSNHVVIRAFSELRWLIPARRTQAKGKITKSNWIDTDWIDRAIIKEQERIEHALSFLSPICGALEDAGDVIVIKSLDHWPDLGSDLDLYTNADPKDVVSIMRKRFKAHVAERSWGDRLANKWNFIVPGLPELVEVHVGRLGQTGEQIEITQSLIARSRMARFGSHEFRVPAPENRIIISTLQRMYRHFYVRLCDVADNARLVEKGANGSAVDYGYLKSLAESAGLWDGLATYLVIVSEYVSSYRGEGLPLPSLVIDGARFDSSPVHFRRSFLRIPIFPHSVKLYFSEWKKLLLNGELQSTLRLSLLPGLATAAALELKLTGSDKGIW
jgi:hypothetical protein